MDALDLRIIRAMGVRPFESWPRPLDPFKAVDIAIVLGTTPETIKQRIQKMESGFIAGYEIYPNVRYLGLEQSTFHVRIAAERKGAAKAAMEPMEGIIGLYDFLGEDLCIDMCYTDDPDLRRKMRLVGQLTGTPAVRFYDRAAPAVAMTLDATDWRIVQALRGQARRDLAEVAMEIGVHPKTVRRRFVRMHAAGAIDRVVSIHAAHAPNLFLFTLVAVVEAGRAATQARLLEAFDDRLLYAWWPPEIQQECHLMLFAETTGEVEALRQRAAQIDGVGAASVRIPTEVIYHGQWLDEAIARRVGPFVQAA